MRSRFGDSRRALPDISVKISLPQQKILAGDVSILVSIAILEGCAREGAKAGSPLSKIARVGDAVQIKIALVTMRSELAVVNKRPGECAEGIGAGVERGHICTQRGQQEKCVARIDAERDASGHRTADYIAFEGNKIISQILIDRDGIDVVDVILQRRSGKKLYVAEDRRIRRSTGRRWDVTRKREVVLDRSRHVPNIRELFQRE